MSGYREGPTIVCLLNDDGSINSIIPYVFLREEDAEIWCEEISTYPGPWTVCTLTPITQAERVLIGRRFLDVQNRINQIRKGNRVWTGKRR